LVAGALLAVWMTIVPATADAPPRHIRGTIEAVDGRTVTVQTAGGKIAPVTLADDAKVFTVAAADISAIKDGKFVGITSVERNGRRVAVEVHVFDESLRGRGEGDRPWDLESEPNMMTNANIAQVKAVGDDRVLTLAYKDGSQTIAVPPDATIVTITPGTPDELKPGAKVFVIAHAVPEGRLAAASISVGKDGLKPPM
jgi:Cu/Ag efflux protein CusF